MTLHPEELALARDYAKQHPIEGLTQKQMHSIMERGRELHHWFKSHTTLHHLISLSVLLTIFSFDWLTLTWLPHRLLPAGGGECLWCIAASAAIVGGIHSWLMYSLTVFSMHEGAAHRIIFLPTGPIGRFFNFIANNLCRLAAGEPLYYSEHHMSHHAKFGTEGDGELLNFIAPRRYWLTFLPFAAFLNYTDFVAHRPPRYTVSRVISALAALSYNIPFALYLNRHFGTTFTLIAMVVFMPHVGFVCDRLRQFTEHNLMPLENRNGARSFGLGFWGMLVGGGPWGSPCHWEHHLVGSLPWYQQLILHRHVVSLLTPRQRKQFLIEPVIGFPKLWWRIWKEARSFQAHATIPATHR